MAFVFLFGYPPFHGEDDPISPGSYEAIFRAIEAGFEPEVKDGWGAWFPEEIPVSANARDFLARLLTSDTANRLTAEEALNHPWIASAETAPHTPIGGSVVKSLETFVKANRFQQAVLEAMTHVLTDFQVEEIEASFKAMDADGNGKISFVEVSLFFKTFFSFFFLFFL
jgi:calcium-dependent protein kinase